MKRAFAQQILKLATKHDWGRRVGAALKGAVVGGAELGAGVAEGLGGNATAGKVIGGGTVVLTGASVAGSGKRKVDEWRYRHGLY